MATTSRWRPVGGHIAIALGLLVPITASACASGTSADTGTSANTSPPEDQQWGPLAVADSASGDDALISGAIRITERCLFLDEQGRSVLLVWPSERTTWDDEDRSVRFVASSGETMVFGNGDQATLGGGGYSSTEAGGAAEDLLESLAWTAEPAPECGADTLWFVSDAATG